MSQLKTAHSAINIGKNASHKSCSFITMTGFHLIINDKGFDLQLKANDPTLCYLCALCSSQS